MITDRIKFKPGFAKEDSKTFASGGVEVNGIDPDRLWRNLTNISAWPRYSEAIVDINFEDTGTNDPHLYDKAQFNYDLANGMHVVAQVIFFQHPKEDRPGRLAYQGTVFNADGKCIERFSSYAQPYRQKKRHPTPTNAILAMSCSHSSTVLQPGL